MTFIIITALSLILAGGVSAFEYHHGWARLYNKIALFITIKTKWNINPIKIPPTPHAFKHEWRVFIACLIISLIVMTLITLGYDLARIF